MQIENQKDQVNGSRGFCSQRERGVALIAVMLALLLITAIAAGVIILTNTETNTSANFKDEQRAFFSAKAGLEEVRDRLRLGNSYTITTLPTTLPGGTNSVLYITNPLNSQTVTPWGNNTAQFADDEICTEPAYLSASWCSSGYPSGSGVTMTSLTADTTFQPASGSVLDWKWVRVTLKQSNEFGSAYAVDGNNSHAYYTCLKDSFPNEVISSPTATSPCVTPAYLPVYVLTALAVTPSGSRRMVQAEVGQDTFQFNAPAALTLDGSGDSFATGKSENYGVNGNDSPGCGIKTTGSAVAAIGVPSGDTTDQNNLITQIDTGVNNNTSKESNIQGAGGKYPDVEAVTMPTNLTSETTLQNLISTIKSDITTPVVNGPATDSAITWCPKKGTCSEQIVYVNGDLTLTGGGTANGILVVTGTLTMKGSSTWNGLIFVVGTGSVIAKGTDTVNGAMVVANTTGSTLGAATMDVSGGGTGGVNFSSGCILQASTLSTYHVISMRELMN